ncbi:MAG: HU family DNA-binding protein [Porticoccaceae bacterium]
MAAKKASAKPVAKPVAKKAPAKKAAPAKKKATPAAVKKPAPISKTNPIATKYTKTQMLIEISEATSLTKKQVGSVLDQITSLIDRHIKKRGVGEFTLPGLLKIKTVKKPARKARKGINPFTKQETVFKARPASTAVKVLPLKALKDMVIN